MASRYSLESVFSLLDKFTAPLSKITRSTKTFSQSFRKDFAKAQRQVRNFGNNIKRHAWIGVTAVAAGFALMAKEGIGLASSLFEVQNVVDTTFDDSSKVIDAWAKKAIEAFGLSELQAKEFTGTLGSALKSSGIEGDALTKMSTDLVGLAGDYASFRNLSIEESFEKIKSGMMGQSKPLRDWGINMSVANLEAFALSQGMKKQFKNMSEAEKMALRYNFIWKASTDAQGDFNKTLQDSLANQQRVVKTKFAQKLANAFQKLIPVLIKVYDGFSKFLDTIDTDAIGDFALSVFNAIKKGVEIFIAFLKIIKPFAPFIVGIIAAFALYKVSLLAAAAAQMIMNAVMMANPIGLIIIAIGILIGFIIIIVKHWDDITNAFKKAWDWIVKLSVAIWDNLVNAFKVAIDWISKTGQKFTFILGPIGFLISAFIEIGKNWDKISEKFKGGDILGGILAIGGAILSGLLAPIQGFLELVSKIPGVGDLAKGAAEKIQELRFGLTGKKEEDQKLSPVNPYERSSVTREERNSRGELIIRDETGRAELGKQKEKSGYKIQLQHSGGFR